MLWCQWDWFATSLPWLYVFRKVPVTRFTSVVWFISNLLVNLTAYSLLKEVSSFHVKVAYTTLCDWFKKSLSRWTANEMKKPNPNATSPHTLASTRQRLLLFASRFYWLVVLFTFLMIGHCNCFGFGFTILNKKPFWSICTLYISCILAYDIR